MTQTAIVAAGAGWKPISGAVTLSLDFQFPIPKSRKELSPGMPHLQDPDCTNLLKNLEDGLKRVLFTDDNMVAKLTVSKCWCEAGKEGVGVMVEIEEVCSTCGAKDHVTYEHCNEVPWDRR